MFIPFEAGLPLSAAVLHEEQGLERLMGDRALYLQLLQRFRHDYQQVARELRLGLAAGQHPAMQRKVHTLKGAAGMIGATTVYQQASALEPQCVPPGTVPEAVLAQLEQHMDALLARVDDILNAAQGRTGPAPPTTADTCRPAAAAVGAIAGGRGWRRHRRAGTVGIDPGREAGRGALPASGSGRASIRF